MKLVENHENQLLQSLLNIGLKLWLKKRKKKCLIKKGKFSFFYNLFKNFDQKNS